MHVAEEAEVVVVAEAEVVAKSVDYLELGRDHFTRKTIIISARLYSWKLLSAFNSKKNPSTSLSKY